MELPPDGPFATKNLVPTLIAVGISVAGGVLSFYQKVKNKRARWINVTELIGEMFVSAVVGLVAFWICKGFGVNEYLSAATVAITGHMGARAIFLAEQFVERKTKEF